MYMINCTIIPYNNGSLENALGGLNDCLFFACYSYQNGSLLSIINFNDHNKVGSLAGDPTYTITGMILSKTSGTIVTSTIASGYFYIYTIPTFTLTLQYYT